MTKRREKEIDIREMYSKLEKNKELQAEPFNRLATILHLSKGINEVHSRNIMMLYFYYLRNYDVDKYKLLKAAEDEKAFNDLIPNFMTEQKGLKSTAVYTEMFDDNFMKIINEYIYYVKKLQEEEVQVEPESAV
jgi:hypothetical protein